MASLLAHRVNYVQKQNAAAQKKREEWIAAAQNAAARKEMEIQEIISRTRANRRPQVDRAIKRLRIYAIIAGTGALILFIAGGGFCGIQVAEAIHASLLTSIIGGVIGAIIGFTVIFGLIRTGVLSLRLFDRATYSRIFKTKGKELFSNSKKLQNQYIVCKFEQKFHIDQAIPSNYQRIYDIYLNYRYSPWTSSDEELIIDELKTRHPSFVWKSIYKLHFEFHDALPQKAIYIDIYDMQYENINVPSAYSPPGEYFPPAPVPNFLKDRKT